MVSFHNFDKVTRKENASLILWEMVPSPTLFYCPNCFLATRLVKNLFRALTRGSTPHLSGTTLPQQKFKKNQ